MAISNFIPEIWSAALLTALRDRLTYAQPGMVNRNYEGDVARAGDTVHITSVGDPGVRDYTRNSGTGAIDAITYDLLSDTTKTLTIDQSDYFAFQVDDIDRRQALGGFVEEAARGASYGLAKATDVFVSGLMATNAGSKVTGQYVDPASPNQAYDLLVNMRTVLQRANCPDDGRWVVVPPEFYAVLLHDDRFIRQDASGTTAGLRNGFVGRAAGFDVIESNVVPATGSGATTEYTVLGGHDMATTYADQITETEGLRLESSFSDAIRGLHVYGGLVTRPALLASVKAKITAAPTG